MQVTIDPDLERQFPGITVCGFVARALGSAKGIDVSSIVGEAERSIHASGLSAATLPDHPLIAPWRAAARHQGLKPSTFRSSPETLVRRTLKKGHPRTPIKVVDLYNAISVTHIVPLGGYDVDRIDGRHIVLRFADPEYDVFSPLGGKSESFPLLPSVAVYAAETEVLCWGFNHRDSKNTCLTERSEAGLFVGEAIDAMQAKALGTAMAALRVQLSCSGAVCDPLWCSRDTSQW